MLLDSTCTRASKPRSAQGCWARAQGPPACRGGPRPGLPTAAVGGGREPARPAWGRVRIVTGGLSRAPAQGCVPSGPRPCPLAGAARRRATTAAKPPGPGRGHCTTGSRRDRASRAPTRRPRGRARHRDEAAPVHPARGCARAPSRGRAREPGTARSPPRLRPRLPEAVPAAPRAARVARAPLCARRSRGRGPPGSRAGTCARPGPSSPGSEPPRGRAVAVAALAPGRGSARPTAPWPEPMRPSRAWAGVARPRRAKATSAWLGPRRLRKVLGGGRPCPRRPTVRVKP
jgi:hypothetical protein